jgi:glycosyltransferase involved in cell wall biosynthesis
MHIAFIGQKGIDLGEKSGGVEQHVGKLASGLLNLEHKVTVYARSRYSTSAHEDHEQVRVLFLPTIYLKNLEAIIHTFLSTLHALFQPYDIIHYHGVGPATLSWIPRLLKRRARVIVTFHSQDRFHRKWGLFARLYLHFGEVASCWFPHAAIAVSHVIQVYARKHYRRQIVFIPNGATVQHVSSDSELSEFDLESGEYVLNVSRLVPHKGQHYLIQAFKQLDTNKKLVLVGAPSYTLDYLRELKALAGNDPRIMFTGFQSGETLKQLFAHAYLYVQPSESEGLPVVVLESMSFGTPVLVSDIPENLEAMHHAGFSFENTNVDDLTKKLKDLLDHPDRVQEAAERVQDIIQNEFNWDVIVKKTEALYRLVRH